MTAYAGKKIFVESGRPAAVMGSAVKDIIREGNGLVIPPGGRWGNTLFADAVLEEKDFHIHALLTLDRLAGTGASFLLGGHYHYPCSRPEGNLTFRVSLDTDYSDTETDVKWVFKPLEMGTRIVHGMTEPRAPWCDAKKENVGNAGDHIAPGKPFRIDLFLAGPGLSFQIDGKVIFAVDLKDKITGPGDGGWPVCFGFFSDRGVVRLHEFNAEGSFSAASVAHQDVWSMGRDGYFTYRIPSLCVTPKGSLLAFAEARRFDFCRARNWKNRNADEMHCVMKRSTDGGKTWSAQRTMVERRSVYGANDPSPLVDSGTGDVFLLTRGPYIMKSADDGESWSEPRPLRGCLGEGVDMMTPGPCHGIQLRHEAHRGRLMMPVYRAGIVGVIYSDDHGERWVPGGMTTAMGGNEPQLMELEDGRILMNSRNHSENPGRLISISRDGGTSFMASYDAQLSSQRCQASILRYGRPGESAEGKKRPVLFCGPDIGRTVLTVKLSYDECESWPISRVIYTGHAAYSAMAVLPDGQIGVLYERDRYRRLSFVKFPLEWIENGQRP